MLFTDGQMRIVGNEMFVLSQSEERELVDKLTAIDHEATQKALQVLTDRHKVEFTLLKGDFRKELIAIEGTKLETFALRNIINH